MGQAIEASSDWAEVVDPEEEQRHQAFADTIVALQTKINAKSGEGRGFHRKQIAGLRGEFTVLKHDAPELAKGLFAEPRTLPCLVRMSNGAITEQADVVPDIRGLAISVRDVDGRGALLKRTDRQDFLLINRSSFGFTDSRGFAEVVEAAAGGQIGLAKAMVKEHGAIGGPVELAKLSRDLLRPFGSFATATFFSSAPIQYGPYAVRVRATPVDQPFNPLAASLVTIRFASGVRTIRPISCAM